MKMESNVLKLIPSAAGGTGKKRLGCCPPEASSQFNASEEDEAVVIQQDSSIEDDCCLSLTNKSTPDFKRKSDQPTKESHSLPSAAAVETRNLGIGDQQQLQSIEPKNKKRRGQKQHQNKVVFMEGIPRVKPVADMSIVSNVQKRMKVLTGSRLSFFSGCQPVSMNMENLKILLPNSYKVSWKADGTRYMMYINGRDQYFINRNNDVFQIDGLTFYSDTSFKRLLFDTLVDGEMVIDKEPDGSQRPRYLMYDVISFEGNQISQECFNNRMRTIQKFIIGPRYEALKTGRIVREREPIGVCIKEFFDLKHTGYLLGDKFKNKLGHERDGLVFQPINDPYKPGTCPEVLKWKPPSHNSVDFRLKIVEEHRVGMLHGQIGQLFVGGQLEPFAEMKVNKALHEFNNKIIECRYEFNGATGSWIFMRERTDKSSPNSFKTAQSVCKSINEPVTTQILLKFVEAVCGGRHQPQVREQAIPPSSRLVSHQLHRS